MSLKYFRWCSMLLLFIVLALLVVAYSLTVGELKISLLRMPSIFLHGNTTPEYTILTQIRLPRILLGLSVGGALSLSGVILQGIYRNPLVEPYTLGISGGAALGVAIAVVMGLPKIAGSAALPVFGFIGALTAVILVYVLSIRQSKIMIQKMVLIGVMISFIASSAMMFLMATTNTENLHGIVFWVMGSLDESNFMLVKFVVILSIFCLVFTYFFTQPLNALRLGEEKARYLGMNTDLTVKILFVITSLLTGVCVSLVGVIGFVGLVIPHILRYMVGSDFRILLISSFIGGGTFLVFCDTIARTIISPNELPVGVITGMVGGIVFIMVLSRSDDRSVIGK